MALNPDPDHWHKLAAILMHKSGVDHEVITLQDMEDIPEGIFIVVQELTDGLHLRLVDEVTAHRLAREHGGQ